MSKIFISYRRDDSGYVADSIYKRLCQDFDPEAVFFDVEGMPLGVEWDIYLRERVQECAVMLVVIGKHWLDMRDPVTDIRRLDQPTDFVRYEIETALARGIPLIPLFLDGMTGLPENRLPASIQRLAKRQGIEVRRLPYFEYDMSRLVTSLTELIGYMSKGETPDPHKLERSHSNVKLSRSPDRDFLPRPFDWIEIPGKDYGIAKYPITNAQFKLFIDAGGYSTKEWWTNAGWESRSKGWIWDDRDRDWVETNLSWKQPRYWTDPKWNRPDHPVVGVSWFEAVAYCNWLSSKLAVNIVLPSEDQWQYAAQGKDGRNYPWGDDWDCNKCNNSVKPCSSNYTTPVQHYEGKGDSPFGVVDMAGNIWEWCVTDYNRSTNDIHVSAISPVLKGGAWKVDNAGSFRCDFRGRYSPRSRDPYRGFRLVYTLG